MKNTITIITSVLFLAFWGCEEPDTTPPDISIASPVNGAVVSDTVTIKTVVADNDGISNVEFFLDGDLLTTVSEEPFETDWNTSETTNGAHTLQCKAVDNSDNETLSESIQVTVANALFTANFTNDWLCADCGEGIIFISDMDGNVLAEATWTGNASFEIEAPEDLTEFPERISVTTVRQGGLRTNLDIPVGSSWTWKGYPSYPDNLGDANLEFTYVPEHIDCILSSLWSGWNIGVLSSTYTKSLYQSPDDIYIKLNTIENGHRFKWINDVEVDGYYQVDLSTLETPESKEISFPNGTNGFQAYLNGYPQPGNHYNGDYTLDNIYATDSIANSITLYYPPTYFYDYRTTIFSFNDYENIGFWDFYYQSTYGDIPSVFTSTGADFDFISYTPDNFNINVTGEFDEIRSSWRFDDGENYSSWLVYGPTDLTQYSLPTLPNTVTQEYQYIDKDSYEIVYSDLIDHTQLSSYEEILDVLFNSPDYFYDVVSDFNSRVKSPESTTSFRKLTIDEYDISRGQYSQLQR